MSAPTDRRLLCPTVAAVMELQCPLCGGRYAASSGDACGGCPISGGCSAHRCPYCSYPYPASSRWLAWVRRTLEKWRSR